MSIHERVLWVSVMFFVVCCVLSLAGCSVYTGPIRQCPEGWPQDVFDKLDEVKSVCKMQ